MAIVLNYDNLDKNIIIELNKYPEALEAIAKWVKAPNRELFPELYRATASLTPIAGQCSEYIVYRGLSITNNNQDSMGITHRHKEGELEIYSNKLNPLSFTTDISVAKEYGDILINSHLSNDTYSYLVLTDEIMWLVNDILKNTSNTTEKEIILLPEYSVIFKILEIK